MDNISPEQILKKITDQFGEEIFLDKNRSIGLISDYFGKQHKPQKLYINAIRENLPQKLLEIKHLNEVEIEQSVRKIKYYFKDDNGYDEQSVNFIINSFIYALEIKTKILTTDSQEVSKKTDPKEINIKNYLEQNLTETPKIQENIINTPTITPTPPAIANKNNSSENAIKRIISFVLIDLFILFLIRSFVIFPVYNSQPNITFFQAFNERFDWPIPGVKDLKQYAFNCPTRTTKILDKFEKSGHLFISKYFSSNTFLKLVGCLLQFPYIILFFIFIDIPYFILFIVFTLIFLPFALITPLIDNITLVLSPGLLWTILGIIMGIYHGCSALIRKHSKTKLNIAAAIVVSILLISFWNTYTHQERNSIPLEKSVITESKDIK